jgi:chromosome segregation ATPase
VLEVTTQRPRLNAVQLAGQSRQALLAYAKTGGIDAKAAAALEKLAASQGEVERLDRLAKDAEAEAQAIAKDQDRLRQNLQSVPAGGDLAKRYLDTLKKQEDRIDQLRAAEADAKGKLKPARDALADAIQKTEI